MKRILFFSGIGDKSGRDSRLLLASYVRPPVRMYADDVVRNRGSLASSHRRSSCVMAQLVLFVSYSLGRTTIVCRYSKRIVMSVTQIKRGKTLDMSVTLTSNKNHKKPACGALN